MDLMDAINHRRAVRHYTDAPVSNEMIEVLLEAACAAPSAINQQPWAFAVIQGRKKLEAYSEQAKQYLFATLPQLLELHRRSDQLREPSYNVFHHAGTLIVIYAKPAGHNPFEDCCLAAQNLLLAAHGMGLGACPIGFARPWLDQTEVKIAWGVPVSYHVVMPVVAGWPAGPTPPVPRHRPEVFNWFRDDHDGPHDRPGESRPPGPAPA